MATIKRSSSPEQQGHNEGDIPMSKKSKMDDSFIESTPPGTFEEDLALYEVIILIINNDIH